MNSQHDRTFRLDRLYHQFLKPKGLSLDLLPRLVSTLYEARFIDLYTSEDLETERYTELPKLLNRQHKDELFKIIQKLSDEVGSTI